jgi:hypothetical protein
MLTCPTDVIQAPAEKVWSLLTVPEEVAGWTKTRLLSGPGRPMEAGDQIVYGVKLGMKVVFKVLSMEVPNELAIDVDMPLGVVNHEVIHVTPLGDASCRVSFG